MSTLYTGGEPAAIGSGDRPLVDGDIVGEYVIRDQIGKGGFGTVYRATHPVIGKQVAIKVLARRYSADQEIVDRFVDEARAVNQIRHRNIIDIFSFGQLADGRHYYVMEYLDGTPLDRYLKEHGVLRLEEALPILRAIARALDAAHAKGIAHRDLKPENVVLSFDDEGQIFPKLLDFGIAKLTTPDEERAHRTGTGVPLGTPLYMSPEQCRGRDVDHRTDLYSFGVLTFRLLTGDYPFHGEMIEILHKQMHEDPPRPSSINPALDSDIDRTIAWMMHKDPAQRPATAITAVVSLQGEATVPTPRVTPVTLRPFVTGSVGRGADQTADTLAATASDTLAAATGDTLVPGTLSGVTGARRSRTPLWIGVAVLLAGAIATVGWLATRSPSGQSAPPSAVTPAGPQPSTASAPDPAPPVVAVPAHVVITLVGAPDGADVRIGGKSIGIAPTVVVDRATTQTVLTVFAEGYHARPFTVTPDRDQELRVDLRKKARAGTGPRAPGKEEIIHDIPGLTK